jgi:adenylosuccinate synthase
MSVTVVVGAQWGDEGKGKIVDFLAEQEQFDVGARFNGGPNAGHTVVVDEGTFKLHHLPSTLVLGRKSIMGCGMVIEPEIFFRELHELESRLRKVTPDMLFISKNAHIITPQARLRDSIKGGKIGTTGRGIGPTYCDKADRTGIRVVDMINPDELRKKLEENLSEKNFFFENLHKQKPIDIDDVFEQYREFGERMKPFVTDTSVMINKFINKGLKVLAEGAQGTYLDINYGTYPFVTSSNVISGAACTGLGISPMAIKRVIGVAKAYTTRVGEGPFPTERTGDWGEKVREDGNEFGTTTGRPRRVGDPHWGMLKYAAMLNGITGWAVTKLDVLGGREFRVALGHRENGETVDFNPEVDEIVYSDKTYYWDKLSDEDYRRLIPNGFAGLPDGMKEYLLDLAGFTRVPVAMASVGPERDMTVVKGILEATKEVLGSG